MGCDIHAYVEKKIDGNWHMISEVSGDANDRDYHFFARLCGVRSYDPDDHPAPKGLPNDVSFVCKHLSDEYGCDGHSHSYETAESFVRWKRELQESRGSATQTSDPLEWLSWGILGYDIYEGDLENHRVVFWFDN